MFSNNFSFSITQLIFYPTDAVIAATSLVHATPKLAIDKSFSQIEELDLVLITF